MYQPGPLYKDELKEECLNLIIWLSIVSVNAMCCQKLALLYCWDIFAGTFPTNNWC